MSLHITDPDDELHEYINDRYDDYDASFYIRHLTDHEYISDEETEYTVSADRIHIVADVVPVELHLLQSLQDFVANVGNPKKVMGMINYHYRKDEIIPYDGMKPIPCTRLELESEMKLVSDDDYKKFIAKLSDMKMGWMIHNHNIRHRSFSEANITSLIYENYVGKYVCVAEGRSTSVWCFDDMWIEISPAEIWQEVYKVIDFVRSYSTSNAGKQDSWAEMCDDVAQYLSSVISREHIQKDLLFRLTDNKFQSKLNSKSHLIGVENGVYDFKKGVLRDALPMDYVSMSTRVKYLDEVDDDLYEELKEILRTIFPNKKVRKFFIQSCASLLEGRNKDKFVYVWWGKGNNGKSMIEKLLSSALGDYSTVAATSLVTGKRSNADAANPQLSALEGKLAVFLQEPNPNETIKIGMVKELSGNDAITARALFKGNRTFTPKFKLIIVCNSAIEIPNIDIAFTNRLIVIPFQSTFWTKDDYRRRKKKGELSDHDFPMDTSIGRNITKYAEVFLRMLVKEYESGRDMRIPRIVRHTTRDYIEVNNFSLLFIRTQTIDDEAGETNIKTLHSEMKRWMNDHYTGKKVPNIEMFRDELTNQAYEVDSKGIVRGLIVDYE
jgi:P4 family phage/plasmid primase-like protien